MTSPGRTALFVRVPAVDAAIEPGWSAWYDRSHIDYRMGMPGFLGARRYVMRSAKIRVVAIYEMTTPAALTTPEYMKLRQWEGTRPPGAYERIAPNLPGFERGLYEELGGRDWPADRLDTPAVFLTGHDPRPGDEQAFEKWYGDTHEHALGAVRGVVAVRRFRQIAEGLAPNSGTRTPHPRYFTICYLDGETAANEPALQDAIAASLKWNTGNAGEPMLGQRVHSAIART